MSAQSWLVLIGGALQVGGVALAAWDLVDAYRRWRAYTHRTVTVELPPLTMDAVMYAPEVRVEPPPPLEDRVASLERAVLSLQREHADARVEDKQAARRRTNDAVDAVMRRLTGGDEALAGLFRGVVIGGRRRWIGLGCFLVGIVAATVGSLPVWGR